jgi:hypothetical protein
VLLAYQRFRVADIAAKRTNIDVDRMRNRANIGLIVLGVISILNIYFNITLHRGWWNGDFFSPFFN